MLATWLDNSSESLLRAWLSGATTGSRTVSSVRHLDRRAFVRLLGVGTLGVLAACAQAPASPQPTVAPTAAPTASSSSSPTLQPLSPRVSIKLTINPTAPLNYLPFFVALDKGYFSAAGLDVDAADNRGPTAGLLPLLARGDLDIGIQSPTPPLYNQVAGGFDVKIVASMSQDKTGRAADAWLTIIADKVNEIKTPADLKGRTIEAGAQGTALDFLVQLTLQSAGLTAGKDVNVTYRARATADMFTIAQQKGADVVTLPEPFATQAEQQGIAQKWLTWGERSGIAPWYQSSILGASAQLINERRPGLVQWLAAYLIACREINATNGVWTPELLDIVTRRSGLPAEQITAPGAVKYFDPNGAVSIESLAQSQELWAAEGLVQTKVDVNQLVDNSPLDEAVQRIGRA